MEVPCEKELSVPQCLQGPSRNTSVLFLEVVPCLLHDTQMGQLTLLSIKANGFLVQHFLLLSTISWSAWGYLGARCGR